MLTEPLPFPAPEAAKERVRRLVLVAVALSLAHGVNDAYVAFLPPLLPRIMEKLGLSIALAATLAMVLSISASLLQPLVGYLADRHGRRLFVIIGPLLTGLFLSLMGLAPTFLMLLAVLAVGGLGSALFHPPAATIAARAREGKGSGFRLSIFSFGGTMGFALGPLIAVALVSVVGLEGLWVAVAPAVLVAVFLAAVLPAGPADRADRPPPAPGGVLLRLRGPLGLVFGISALAAFVQRLFVTFEPIIVDAAGGSEALGAVALSVYLGAHGAGTLAGGFSTDRVDRVALLAGLCFLAVPAHLAAVWLPVGSAGAFAAIACAGFLNMAMLPPIVVIAQESLPEGAAMTSGIAMGLAWAAGSLGVIGAGALADAVGPRTAAALSIPLLLAGTPLALHPSLRPYRRPRPAGSTPEREPTDASGR